jgi:sulfite exporter TauE/SafE
MLASIHPLGERARRSRWWLTTSAYLTGSAAGGALLGAVAGTAGAVLHLSLSPWAAAAVCVIIVVLDQVGVPSWHRQVNEDWLRRYRGWVYGGGFGFQLGLGVVTIVSTAAVYAVAVLAALTGSLVTATVIGTVFGASRSLPLLAVAGVRRPEQLRRLHVNLQRAATPVRRVASSTLMVAAVAALVAAR